MSDRGARRRLIILGIGGVARALVQLITRLTHTDAADSTDFLLLDRKFVFDQPRNFAINRGLYRQVELSASNIGYELRTLGRPGDIVVNLIEDLDQRTVILACEALRLLYIDAAVTPRPWSRKPGVSALCSHGGVPGLACHFAKIFAADSPSTLKALKLHFFDSHETDSRIDYQSFFLATYRPESAIYQRNFLPPDHASLIELAKALGLEHVDFSYTMNQTTLRCLEENDRVEWTRPLTERVMSRALVRGGCGLTLTAKDQAGSIRSRTYVLPLDSARRLSPVSNSMSVMAALGLFAGLKWIDQNDSAGTIYPTDLDPRILLAPILEYFDVQEPLMKEEP